MFFSSCLLNTLRAGAGTVRGEQASRQAPRSTRAYDKHGPPRLCSDALHALVWRALAAPITCSGSRSAATQRCWRCSQGSTPAAFASPNGLARRLGHGHTWIIVRGVVNCVQIVLALTGELEAIQQVDAKLQENAVSGGSRPGRQRRWEHMAPSDRPCLAFWDSLTSCSCGTCRRSGVEEPCRPRHASPLCRLSGEGSPPRHIMFRARNRRSKPAPWLKGNNAGGTLRGCGRWSLAGLLPTRYKTTGVLIAVCTSPTSPATHP